ncbi:MAG: hypothetical protein U5L11_02660 [Arhodomonas sp.]|nr:hypothetical protein [Arhodomonas sp.]
MEQTSLFHEDFHHSLRDARAAIGGVKRMAGLVYPNLPLDKAHTMLANALNPDRRERLELEDVVAIMRHARAAGCHIPMAYLARELDYAPPETREPENELAALQREFIERAKAMERMASQISRLNIRLHEAG